MNSMRELEIEKVTLNIGVGEGGKALSNAEKVLEEISNQKPVRTRAKQTHRDFGIRKGAPIGCKITLRGEKAFSTLKKLFDAKDKISKSSFDGTGNFSFGIKEHIDIPGMKYDPDIGIYGMDVCVTLSRPGYRIKKRRQQPRSIPKSHRIKKEEAIDFMQKNFDIQVV